MPEISRFYGMVIGMFYDEHRNHNGSEPRMGTNDRKSVVGRDACRLGIAPLPRVQPTNTARNPDTTRGIRALQNIHESF
jgi:hypothetical protein